MPQNDKLPDDRLAHIHQSLKRWAEHDNALNSYISGKKIDPIFHDCVVALSELMERRKYEKPEPVSFDMLNAAVAEVTGSNLHAWNANIYKGHQEVPFINYNSLSRIVEKFRLSQQPLPDDVLAAVQKVARIRLDLDDFDGDRRGIAECLGKAEEALVEVVNRCAVMLQPAIASHKLRNDL
ncbi:hypothetical protein WP7S18C02_22840 [Klebsiella sp. WP7-S18-CRE-02]|uniref:hypothetical protein n=1 Tax=unclassified Klebsiella TaxID=2608929 RepID=UPI0015DBFE34|nr:MULTISPECIES: hypothetical protein [unclassified Klebsiella]BBS91669.1 hypothetical protein WP7S18C02_22840 [Klebsiella sp. WP7-S18-CRE-02]BBS96691.1 hypothetical protein WP7S18C03_22840 [Klebsiella sp. WP7-S18-CRE-03]BBT01723.1 hypothetical protein WP7S18E04_22850 [Klebsiella sp. WP7-S18-ESBL-04]